MNDRFRFKAWDKKNKVMHNQGSVGRYYDDGLCNISFDGDCGIACISIVQWFLADDAGDPDPIIETLFPGEFVLLESTGLKDKNGELIWEGDVLSVNEHYCGDYEIKKRNAKVCYESGDYILALSDGEFHGNLGDACQNNLCEIIGSIYTHPDLLGCQHEQ